VHGLPALIGVGALLALMYFALYAGVFDRPMVRRVLAWVSRRMAARRRLAGQGQGYGD
jgi:hypothetical protein